LFKEDDTDTLFASLANGALVLTDLILLVEVTSPLS
jgi:hypothetical protein